jgi:transglutaminase-like putative cysteine protease
LVCAATSAHLALALCRALCLLACSIAGYAVGLMPSDFHGFFEVALGARWYVCDTTRMAPMNGLVRISGGRDAADVSFASILGAAMLQDDRIGRGMDCEDGREARERHPSHCHRVEEAQYARPDS